MIRDSNPQCSLKNLTHGPHLKKLGDNRTFMSCPTLDVIHRSYRERTSFLPLTVVDVPLLLSLM